MNSYFTLFKHHEPSENQIWHTGIIAAGINVSEWQQVGQEGVKEDQVFFYIYNMCDLNFLSMKDTPITSWKQSLRVLVFCEPNLSRVLDIS